MLEFVCHLDIYIHVSRADRNHGLSQGCGACGNNQFNKQFKDVLLDVRVSFRIFPQNQQMQISDFYRFLSGWLLIKICNGMKGLVHWTQRRCHLPKRRSRRSRKRPRPGPDR